MHTSIAIIGLQSYAYHGMFEEERRLGQRFCFDVHATLSERTTHRDDHLESSVRYDELVAETLMFAEASTFRTVEALAEAIARRLLSRFRRMEKVRVGVAKLSPPIPETVDRVKVEVEVARVEFDKQQTHG